MGAVSLNNDLFVGDVAVAVVCTVRLIGRAFPSESRGVPSDVYEVGYVGENCCVGWNCCVV